MAEKNIGVIILLVIIACGVIYYFGHSSGLFAVTGTETMVRVLPTSVEPGATFPVTWNVVGASGVYGILLEDTITGGCKFSDGTSKYVGIMFNPETTKTLTMTAPASGSCTFTGIYNLGNVSQKSFTTQVLNVVCVPQWSCTEWGTCTTTCSWAGKDACLATYTENGLNTRTCTDSNSCGVSTGKPAVSQTCTSSCTRTVNKNTPADTNCDGTVNKVELLLALQGYIDSTVSKTDLVNALQAWINGGGL